MAGLCLLIVVSAQGATVRLNMTAAVVYCAPDCDFLYPPIWEGGLNPGADLANFSRNRIGAIFIGTTCVANSQLRNTIHSPLFTKGPDDDAVIEQDAGPSFHIIAKTNVTINSLSAVAKAAGLLQFSFLRDFTVHQTIKLVGAPLISSLGILTAQSGTSGAVTASDCDLFSNELLAARRVRKCVSDCIVALQST